MIESNNTYTVLEFYNHCLYIIHISSLCCFGAWLFVPGDMEIFCWKGASEERYLLKNISDVWDHSQLFLCVCKYLCM